MTRWRRVALQVALSAGALALVAWWVDPADAWDSLRRLDALWAAAAVALNVALLPVYAWRWEVLLRARGLRLPFAWTCGTTAVSNLFAQVLPSALGGDAIRAVELARRSGSSSQAISSVLVDRILGLAGVVLLAALGAVAGGAGAAPGAIAATLGLGAAICVLAGWLTLSLAGRRLLRRLVPVARTVRLERPLRSAYEAVHAYRRHPRALALTFVLACLALVGRVAVVALLARGLGLEVGAGDLLVAVPAVFLTTAVPLTVGGLGVREATFALMLAPAGVAEPDAVALGLAFYAATGLAALAGAPPLLRRAVRG